MHKRTRATPAQIWVALAISVAVSNGIQPTTAQAAEPIAEPMEEVLVLAPRRQRNLGDFATALAESTGRALEPPRIYIKTDLRIGNLVEEFRPDDE